MPAIGRDEDLRTDRAIGMLRRDKDLLEGKVAKLEGPNNDPDMTGAVIVRASSSAWDLHRRSGAMLQFAPDWRDRLAATELHMDVRKRLMRERTLQRSSPARADTLAKRGLLGR